MKVDYERMIQKLADVADSCLICLEDDDMIVARECILRAINIIKVKESKAKSWLCNDKLGDELTKAFGKAIENEKKKYIRDDK